MEEKVEEIKEEPQTIKVGEKEYTQEELSRKVGLGELADELESKWNTKIDRLYPEYTKSTQENTELRKFKEDFEAKQAEEKLKKGEELSPEESKKQAIAEADKLGLIHSGNVNQFIATFLQARDIRDEASSLLDQAKEDGKPTTSVDELVDYMFENGFKDPTKAYKDKYDKELDDWKEKQLSKIKSNGMQTLDTSTAGGKEPEPLKLNNLDSLRDALKTRFQGS